MYLHRERLESISKEFGLPLDKVIESEEPIREKVEEAMAKREVLFGHGPLYPPGSEEVQDPHPSGTTMKQQ